MEEIPGYDLLGYKYSEGSLFGPNVGIFDLVEGASLVWGAKDSIRLIYSMDVHERPDLTSRKVAALPKEWPRSEAVWIVPWSDWQYLSEAGPLPPLSNLKFFKTDRRAPSLPPKSTGPTLLKVHEIQGEWARVSGPEPGTSILDVDNGEATADQNPGYLIHWTAKPLGWIRWRIPGPVPGTKLCAVELDWMGVVD